jgi:5'(3')-deoxyribonucleotidase
MNRRKIIYTETPKEVSRIISKGKIINDFFKEHAKRNKVKYQAIINEVLDKYVKKYELFLISSSLREPHVLRDLRERHSRIFFS